MKVKTVYFIGVNTVVFPVTFTATWALTMWEFFFEKIFFSCKKDLLFFLKKKPHVLCFKHARKVSNQIINSSAGDAVYY